MFDDFERSFKSKKKKKKKKKIAFLGIEPQTIFLPHCLYRLVTALYIHKTAKHNWRVFFCVRFSKSDETCIKITKLLWRHGGLSGTQKVFTVVRPKLTGHLIKVVGLPLARAPTSKINMSTRKGRGSQRDCIANALTRGRADLPEMS